MPTPHEIVADNGGEFASEEMHAFLAEKKIRIIHPPPYHPQSNGALERFHRYLNRVLRMCLDLNDKGEWWPSVRAALDAYRKTPHTATGETPMFLWCGREPRYCIDHLLPTKPVEIWNSETNRFDLAQSRFAYALARKNTCIARLKNKRHDDPRATILKPGDRVYRKNHSRHKLEFVWTPGFRILDIPVRGTAVIEHTQTGVQSRVSLNDLVLADPVSELLGNTSIDIMPGKTQMYFSSEDLADLNWEAMVDAPPLSTELEGKAKETVRDRDRDTGWQGTDQGTAAGEAERNGKRPRRRRHRPARFENHILLLRQ